MPFASVVRCTSDYVLWEHSIVEGPFAVDSYIAGSTLVAGLASSALRERVERVRTIKSIHKALEPENDRTSAVLSAGAAASRQSAQLPAFAPLLEELEVAGWSSHRRMLSPNFHDWSLLDNRTLVVMAGQAVAARADEAVDPIEAALVAQGAWASLRSQAHHASDAGTLLSLAARSLWANVGGNIQTEVAIAITDLEGGHTSVAVAGDCIALRVHAAGCEAIATRQPMLGAVSEFTYLAHSVQLSLRDRIVLMADNARRRPAALLSRLAISFGKLDAEAHRRMMAADAIAMLREERDQAMENGERSATSIVAVQRR
jgi:hypothetical protein